MDENKKNQPVVPGEQDADQGNAATAGQATEAVSGMMPLVVSKSMPDTVTLDPQVGEVPQVSQPNSGGPGGGKKLILGLMLVLILGALVVVLGFLTGRKVREEQVVPEEEMTVPVAEEKDEMTEEYLKQSESDEVEEIENDLQDTSFDGIDQELDTIEQELTTE